MVKTNAEKCKDWRIAQDPEDLRAKERNRKDIAKLRMLDAQREEHRQKNMMSQRLSRMRKASKKHENLTSKLTVTTKSTKEKSHEKNEDGTERSPEKDIRQANFQEIPILEEPTRIDENASPLRCITKAYSLKRSKIKFTMQDLENDLESSDEEKGNWQVPFDIQQRSQPNRYCKNKSNSMNSLN